MLPVISEFTSNSITHLETLNDSQEIARFCIQLLKGNDIIKLSAHEFAHWVVQIRTYLEVGLKNNQSSSHLEGLLKAELIYRKNQPHMPVISSYGVIADDRIVQQPAFRLIPMSRISLGIFKPWGRALYDENEPVSEIIRRKMKAKDEEFAEFVTYGYRSCKKYLNAPASSEYLRIENQQQANSLVQYLASLKTFIWKERINCEHRAQAAFEYLSGFRLDPEQFFFARAGGRSGALDSEFSKARGWSCHEAAAIQIAEDRVFILDPALDSVKALGVSEWAGILGKDLPVTLLPLLLQDGSGRFGDPEVAFAVARGENLPKILEIVTNEQPRLQAVIQVAQDTGY